MTKKRLFQVLDEMNVNDDKNKTAMLGCCFDMVEAKSVKAGGIVTMGVPKDEITKIFLGERQPILLLMDKKEYHRLEATPLDDKLQAAEERCERYEKALKEIKTKCVFPKTENEAGIAIYDILKLCSDSLTPKTNTNE